MGLNRFLSEFGAPTAWLALVGGTVDSPHGDFSFWIERSGEQAVRRVIGCAILVTMPDDGVEEAVTALGEILQFHLTGHYQLPPARQRVERRPGKVVRTAERPSLVVGE